jgi:hypothetical protein
VQIDGDSPKLGQFNVQVSYWILLKLGKQQRLELTVLLETREAKSSLLKVFPATCNCLIVCWRT